MQRILLDTAQLNKLCAALNGNDPDKKAQAEEVMHLLSRDLRAVVTLLHFMEMITHENDEVVRERIRFLKALPRVAFIKNFDWPGSVGTITDLISFEAVVIARNPGISLEKTVDVVRSFAFSDERGSRVFAGCDEGLDIQRTLFGRMAAENRTHVAIISSDFDKFEDCTVEEYYAMQFRSVRGIRGALRKQRQHLETDIRTRGDKRIRGAAASVAAGHMKGISTSAASLHFGRRHPADIFLDFLEMRRDEVPKGMKLSELSDWFLFYKQLSGLPMFKGRSVSSLRASYSPEMFPSWIVQNAQIKHALRLNEHKGSELFDRYLTAFMVYSDMGFADGQRAEVIRQAMGKDALLPQVLQRKVVPQSNLAGLLRDLKSISTRVASTSRDSA